jgi:hypothetical protein
MEQPTYFIELACNHTVRSLSKGLRIFAFDVSFNLIIWGYLNKNPNKVKNVYCIYQYQGRRTAAMYMGDLPKHPVNNVFLQSIAAVRC